MRLVLTVLMIFLLSTLLAVVGAVDFEFPAVFNFGDSNSDTGGLVSGLGKQLYPPNGEDYFCRPVGRYCDGRLIIDFLSKGDPFGHVGGLDSMDLPSPNSYLDSVGAPSFQKGCNFAAAGSTILPPTSVYAVSPFSFGIQVAQFIRFKATVLDLLKRDRRLKKLLPREEYFDQALYTFDIGQNDLAGGFYSKSEDQVLASIPTVLLEFETGVKKLYSEGARRFWIHNTGPLGCLPQNIDLHGNNKDPSRLDELGCVASHNRAARLFNLQLHALCAKLQNGDLPGANITCIDIYSIKIELIANYTRYGFENPIMACCGYGGPPLNYNSQVSCGETKTINGSVIMARGCNDTTEYVNWDGIHYTEAANHHITSQILTGKYSDPPFSEHMPFLLKLKF